MCVYFETPLIMPCFHRRVSHDEDCLSDNVDFLFFRDSLDEFRIGSASGKKLFSLLFGFNLHFRSGNRSMERFEIEGRL